MPRRGPDAERTDRRDSALGLRRRRDGGHYRHDRVVAYLAPAHRPASPADLSALWADLDALAAEIGARWPQGQTAAEAIREERRDL